MSPQAHSPRASAPVPTCLETPHDHPWDPAGLFLLSSTCHLLFLFFIFCGNVSLFGLERAGPLLLAYGTIKCFECFLVEGILILSGDCSNFILSLGKIHSSLRNKSYV